MSKTILSGVVGSTAYGLARAGSDIDMLGIFAAPMTELTGLNWHSSKDTISKSGPGGDDFALHEVGKYFRLALKCNPTVSELLWLEDYTVQTWEGSLTVLNRDAFLSEKHARNSYFGYAKAQLDKFHTHDFKVKHARHALRLLRQGDTLLYEGHLEVRVPDPQVYFDLDDMEPGAILELLTAEFTKFTEKTDLSALPETPNYDFVNEMLTDIRRSNVE